MRFPTLAIVVFAVGCSNDYGFVVIEPEPTITLDERFTEPQQTAISDAIAQWELATDGAFAPTVEIGVPRRRTCDIRAVEQIQDYETGEMLTSRGSTIFHEGEVWIDMRRDTEAAQFHNDMLHELAHSFGAVHGPGLMAPSGGSCIDQVTLDYVCPLLGGCGPNAAPTCD